jgi:hypothetical protein
MLLAGYSAVLLLTDGRMGGTIFNIVMCSVVV